MKVPKLRGIECLPQDHMAGREEVFALFPLCHWDSCNFEQRGMTERRDKSFALIVGAFA